MSHYTVLGVAPDATPADLRKAYRAQAVRLHPDKHTVGRVEELAAAERSMRRLNESWHVLSDPSRRRRYDDALHAPPTNEPIVSAEPTHRAMDTGHGDLGPGRLLVLILLPALLLLALPLIYVFTAYAPRTPNSGPSGTRPTASGAVLASVGDCVIVRGGHVSQIVPCDEPNDGRVTVEVDRGDPCPRAEERPVDGQSGSTSLCLAEVPPR